MLSPIACHTRHSDRTPNIRDLTTRRAKIETHTKLQALSDML